MDVSEIAIRLLSTLYYYQALFRTFSLSLRILITVTYFLI